MQVTAWLPSGSNVPTGGLQITVVPAGTTTGAGKFRTAKLEQVVSVISGGHWIDGFWPPSSTVMSNRHSSLLPQRSSTRQFTVVVPQGNTLPEGGTHVTANWPLLSEASGAG